MRMSCWLMPWARCAALMCLAMPASAAVHLDQLILPAGFHVALYSDQVPKARQIALGTKGTVFVSSDEGGKIYALTGSKSDGAAERVRVLAIGVPSPVASGVAFRHGDLYVSALNKIVVLRGIEDHLDAPPKPQLITDRLPDELAHGAKFIAFGPDGKLYVAIGAPCNICELDQGHAKLIRMNEDGSGWQDVARGVRNSVGFDWQPGSGELWFTDNGRDLLGDDLPSDELNRVVKPGQHFGYPYCQQGDTLDPELGAGKRCQDYVPPVLKLGAHVASLGMRFYTGRQFSSGYNNAAIIAEHGSWNRSRKSGYRVMSVQLQGAKVLAYRPLLSGFEQDGKVWGRPVDVQPLPDGSLLVSDDLAGALYRVSYAKP